jgi:hypothetical protein
MSIARFSEILQQIAAPCRLSFTWAWEDSGDTGGHKTEVTVTSEAAPGGTASCCSNALKVLKRVTITVAPGRRRLIASQRANEPRGSVGSSLGSHQT